jgi:predicted transcriptional regulator
LNDDTAVSVPAGSPVPPAALDQSALAEYLRDPRRAITANGVICLVCGRSFRHLTNTHLRTHGLTSSEYKRRFGYNIGRPLMVTAVRLTHSRNATKSGLAARIRRRLTIDDIEFRRKGGRRPHALEETLTRRETCSRRAPFAGRRDSRGRFTAR